MLKSIFDLLIFKQKLQIIFLVFFMFVKGAENYIEEYQKNLDLIIQF